MEALRPEKKGCCLFFRNCCLKVGFVSTSDWSSVVSSYLQQLHHSCTANNYLSPFVMSLFFFFFSPFFLIRHPSNFCYQVFSNAFYHLRYKISSSDKSGDKKPRFQILPNCVCDGRGLHWLCLLRLRPSSFSGRVWSKVCDSGYFLFVGLVPCVQKFLCRDEEPPSPVQGWPEALRWVVRATTATLIAKSQYAK